VAPPAYDDYGAELAEERTLNGLAFGLLVAGRLISGVGCGAQSI